MNTCKDCFYWDCKIEGGEPYQIFVSVDVKDERTVTGGKCRRYAPHPNFGWTREDEWCGDFSDRELNESLREEIIAIREREESNKQKALKEFETQIRNPIGNSNP